MKYGYFDDDRREYVITKPDTPSAWANYLGSPAYGAIISNQAGGYSFLESGANGRILRYRFDGSDTPGRYLYIRDQEDGDYWSVSWQPVGKDPSLQTCVCRHGLGYTVLETDCREIHAEALYYVPVGETHEVWHLSVRNDSTRPRTLTLTGYAEFTSHSNYEQDQVNLQYSRFITRTLSDGNRIVQQIHGNLASYHENNKGEHPLEERFFGMAGAEPYSVCGDREAFLGRYRTYANPAGVERGDLGGAMSYNAFSCGALNTVVSLQPSRSVEIAFILGRKNRAEQSALMERYADPGARVRQEWDELKKCWDERLSSFWVKTPDPVFDTMVNIWNPYNCYMTFIWSRAASFVYCGLRNGYGYRDTVQDIQGIIHLAPDMAAEKIRFMLTAQVDNGGGLPLVKFTHAPGKEDTPDDLSYVQETGHPAYRADDALWLFPTVWKYVSETGNRSFLDEELPYANRGSDTVYEHLKRAIDFSLHHLGPHGMPAGLYADWNDCLRLGKDGESTFVAFQFCLAIQIMQKFALTRGEEAYAAFLKEKLEQQKDILQRLCWNGDRFIRGFTEQGEQIGNRRDPEANLWLNPQSWAVISGVADERQRETIQNLVQERLNTPYGLLLMDPPYSQHFFDGALAVIYNAGTKENSGIFSQPQGWAILAEALSGNGNRAYRYFSENAPAGQNDQADVRCMEPYCYGQFTEGSASPHHGRSHVHWLTGTASTMMVGCVEGILGIRPDPQGIRLAPAIPSEWEKLEIRKVFRGRRLHIMIRNPDHKESGFSSLALNGQKLDDNYLPADLLKEENEVELTL